MTDARHYSTMTATRNQIHKERPQFADIDSQPAAAATQVSTPLWNLTPQQWRVFLLVGKAMSNKAIAHELHVAESTVKAHVSAIFKMAGCKNRTEAALLSQRVRYGLHDEEADAQLSLSKLAGAHRK